MEAVHELMAKFNELADGIMMEADALLAYLHGEGGALA